MSRFKTILAIIMAYITIAGLVTFSLFILEESFQTVMFGTWPAQDARRWDIVKTGCGLMEKTARTIKVVNYALGWIQPIAFISYRSYAISSSYYVKSLRAKCFAFAPELFVGEKVSFNFTPDTLETLNDSSILATSGKIGVITAEFQNRRNLSASGRLTRFRGFLVVDLRKKSGQK